MESREERDSIEQKLRETSHVIIKRKLGWSSVQWDFICNNSQASLVGILATLNCQVGYRVTISRVQNDFDLITKVYIQRICFYL